MKKPPEPAAPRMRAYDPTKPLPGKALRHLRALGHHLDPVVQVGKEGLTDGIVAAVKEQLLAHELVKVKIAQDSPIDRVAAGAEIADRAGATLVQTLGRTLLFYKRHPHKPRIDFPR